MNEVLKKHCLKCQAIKVSLNSKSGLCRLCRNHYTGTYRDSRNHYYRWLKKKQKVHWAYLNFLLKGKIESSLHGYSGDKLRATA